MGFDGSGGATSNINANIGQGRSKTVTQQNENDQNLEYQNRVEQLKQQFIKDQKKKYRQKRRERAGFGVKEADEKFDYIALAADANARAKVIEEQEGEHLFDVFKRLFNEKLKLYVDRETKYQEMKDSLQEAKLYSYARHRLQEIEK